MKNLLRSQKGQALVELALVFMLFYIFVIGIAQLVLIGSGWMKVHQASRRVVWAGNQMGHTNIPWIKNQLTYLLKLPENQLDIHIVGGNHRTEGKIFEIRTTVKTLGPFRAVWPKGYKIKVRSGVIAHNPHPLVDSLAQKGMKEVSQLIGEIATWAKDELGLSF